MGQEIERKFLVKGEFKSAAFDSFRIVQGYLSSVPERTVRIRVKGEKGYITVKGIGDISRYEWEKEIAVEEANELLKLCEPGVIDKIRYLIKVGEHTYEVDELCGENQGLIIAEIELQAEDEPFIKPEWLGEEVTGDVRYYNAALSKHPYTMWK
ncbi:CYTH domain-containing protein [Odoribacter sp. OttesenSCG-928-J03]|nr:CYTH domain-containing protein [Odoribacter sp. OttesenSCG-928-J03]